MRDLARFVAVNARLEIAEGQFDEATKTLQTGYAMAQHFAEAPFFICALVGMAFSDIMSNQVEELIAQPGSPNMYWALTNLPSPIVSTRKAAAVEMDLLYLMFPDLRNIDETPNTAEHWRGVLDRVYERSGSLLHRDRMTKLGARLSMLGIAAKEYPSRKKDLIARGLSPEQVESMPVAQVVALGIFSEYNQARDELFKWFGLPYWQAKAGLSEAEKLISRYNRRGSFSLAGMLLPALSKCKLAEAMRGRAIALLRVVEAIRIYAAAHEGRLPKTLAEITSVPLPIDPVTGKAFQYKLEGDTAIIEALAPKGTSKKVYAKTLEIKIAK
jgi:hypothetical protein